jgi:adenylate cyclase
MLTAVLAGVEHLQRAFQRFVPRDVFEGIIQRGVHTSGERRVITVLFADLVGFTALSEQSPPEVIVRLLNGDFRAMAAALAEHNGYVSKFMGDGILALFGAPEPNPWHTLDAVKAALAMRAAMDRYNAQLAADGLPALRVHIGIHYGPVVAGILGSAELVEYTAIGDVVNTAARIETLTRRFPVDTDKRRRSDSARRPLCLAPDAPCRRQGQVRANRHVRSRRPCAWPGRWPAGVSGLPFTIDAHGPFTIPLNVPFSLDQADEDGTATLTARPTSTAASVLSKRAALHASAH